MITVRSTINLAHQSVPEVIPAVQGDTGRSILFSLADFTIPIGATARYFITKPSGLAVYNDATIDGNTVLVDLTAQSLAEYGDCPGQVRIMLGQTVVTSFEFILHVEPFRGIDAVESTTETNIFDKAVEDAREAIAEAAEDAEEYISQALDTTLTIPDKAADAKATGDAISDSADAVIAQMRAEIANVYPTETAQGNPATFDDGADEIPVKDLKVSIVPNQDLHGYSKPWAGGANGNLYVGSPSFDGYPGTSIWTKETTASEKYQGYDTYSSTAANQKMYKAVHLPEGRYTFSAMVGYKPSCKGLIDVAITYDDQTFAFLRGEEFTHYGSSSSVTWWRESLTFNLVDQGGTVLVGVMTTSSDKLYISQYQLESGSTATSWVPYENICPITGMTEVDVERTGKNIYNNGVGNLTTNGVTFTKNSDGTISLSGTATSNAFYNMTNRVLPAGTYIANGCPANGSQNTYALNIYDATTTVTISGGDIGSGKEFTTNGSDEYRLVIRIASGTNTNGLVFKPMIRPVSDTDATYAPYSKQTVTTDLGRTVYGGTLDVTTGVLTVDRYYAVMSSLTWSKTSGYPEYRCSFSANNIPVGYFVNNTTVSNIVCSIYKAETSGNTYRGSHTGISNTDTYISVGDASISDIEIFNSVINGQQIAYKIATPQTYQLTPQELLSVLGTNHISTDAESVEVVYRADIQLYIEQLTKPEEDDLIANQAIAAGTFFMIGNRLFLSTASIANGATITPGTNATELSLSDALNSLA